MIVSSGSVRLRRARDGRNARATRPRRQRNGPIGLRRGASRILRIASRASPDVVNDTHLTALRRLPILTRTCSRRRVTPASPRRSPDERPRHTRDARAGRPCRAAHRASLAWDLIRKLVAFDTTSRDSNLALIDWVRGYLRAHGIDSTLTFDDDQRKANLFATLPAQDGNATTNGIVLSGHTDVVPVDGQPWDTDPFDATIDRRQGLRPRRHRHEELQRDRRSRSCRNSCAAACGGRCTSRCPTTRKSAASACAG